jgi:hypothetical protein
VPAPADDVADVPDGAAVAPVLSDVVRPVVTDVAGTAVEGAAVGGSGCGDSDVDAAPAPPAPPLPHAARTTPTRPSQSRQDPDEALRWSNQIGTPAASTGRSRAVSTLTPGPIVELTVIFLR